MILEFSYVLNNIEPDLCSKQEISSTINSLRFAILLDKRFADAIGNLKFKNYVVLMICPGLRNNTLTNRSYICLMICFGLKNNASD